MYDTKGLLTSRVGLPLLMAKILTNKIDSEEYVTGEQLPTEGELCGMFGAGRNAVREALAKLQHDGYVHARQGLGVFVLEPSRRSSFRVADIEDDSDLFNLFELRYILEVQGAEISAIRHNSSDLEKMRSALDDMQGENMCGPGSIKADLAFHSAIAKSIDNSYFYRLLGFLNGKIEASILIARQLNPTIEMLQTNINEHIEILKAIENKNPNDAGLMMSQHLKNSAKRSGLNWSKN